MVHCWHVAHSKLVALAILLTVHSLNTQVKIVKKIRAPERAFAQ